MANIIRRIMRTLLRIIGVDLFEDKDQAAALHSVVDDMRARLTQLRTSTAGLVAEQCRIEHALASERDAMAHAESELHDAQSRSDRESAEILSLRVDTCRARVIELEAQLESARRHSSNARLQLEAFQEELRHATERVRDARVREQLATMKTQAERFALDASLDEDMSAIEHLEARANLASAEAEAIAELNEALRRGGTEDTREDHKEQTNQNGGNDG